jgi:hypothetical protein
MRDDMSDTMPTVRSDHAAAEATPSDHQGPLAEFGALRQQILDEGARQQSIFSLQITTAGAVFGFALSGPGRNLFLLVLPITSYLFCARYYLISVRIHLAGRFIREELSGAIPGGLKWEQWLLSHSRGAQPRAIWLHPSYLAFRAFRRWH